MINYIFKKRIIILLTALIAIISAIFIKSPRIIAVFNSKKLVPIYCVERNDKKISISFDAAWGNEETKNILKILKKNNVKATFFLCGFWIDENSSTVKNIFKDGHDIGNHSDTHPHMSKISDELKRQEILNVHEKIKKITNEECFLFRPPYGEYNDNTIKILRELNYYPIQWSVDSLDWQNLSASQLINRVVNNKKLNSGSIILFHNDGKYTPEALDIIIKSLKEKQYKLVKISDLIYDNYNIDMCGMQLKEDGDILNKKIDSLK